MKKVSAYLLISILLISTLSSCSSKPIQLPESEQTISISPAPSSKQTAPTEVNAVPDDIDIKRALENNLVPENLQQGWDDPITFSQFCSLLQKVIEAVYPAAIDKFNQAAQLAIQSNSNMLREDGMLALYYAADALGVDFSNYNWEYINNSIGEEWDKLSFDYPQFPKWEDAASFEDADWNYMTSAYFYSMGRASLFTNNILFDYDATKKSMRPNDKFTVKEAVAAAERFMDSITVYASMEEATANTILQDTIELAKKMPTVSPQELPKWHGYAMALWDNPSHYNWRYLSENTIKQLSDIGFNFLRMVYHFDELFKEENGTYVVNRTTFENLDDIITWCAKYDMHITVQLHQIPGYGTNGPKEKEIILDILDNPKHYEQALQIYDYMASRYTNVPSNLLSFTLLSEPSLDYFTFESHAKLVEDLANMIRKHTPDRLILASALSSDSQDHWTEALSFQPNYSLDSSIVQAESYYPWHNLRRSAFTQLMNGFPYDEAVVVTNMLQGESKPLTLNGGFKPGTEITYYITNINTPSKYQDKNYLLCLADGKEIGQYSLSGFIEGEKNCSSVLYDNEQRFLVDFGNNGNYNGLEVSFQLTEAASSVELSMKGTDLSYLGMSDILIKTPSGENNSYIVVDNRYQPTGIRYEQGSFTSTIIHCSEIWESPASTVTLQEDGRYTCAETYERDVYDLNSMRAYYDKWEDWSEETGGSYLQFEFVSTFSMPEQVRTSYMKGIMEVFKEYDISWVFSADLTQCGGIIVFKGAEDMAATLNLAEAETTCILPADASYSLNTNYDYPCYYDDAVIKVLQEYMN